MCKFMIQSCHSESVLYRFLGSESRMNGQKLLDLFKNRNADGEIVIPFLAYAIDNAGKTLAV
ncbi:hypothetical protein DNHGIG_21440 [Collibacillus ludicampi]|uniref:Transposase n=1 Tax=Collibacillus ludicampi TaxID=2771369 RepID=A0AAV4LFG2_9BACL|nr:hypothetical protein DNHGIG_21440 [Collibacillus ludicampi]